MKYALGVLPLIAMLVVGTGFAFAENYEIKIPSGASDENYPYFWSQKDTGDTTGIITVHPGDTVTWSNADTAFHTITSVVQQERDILDLMMRMDCLIVDSLLQENLTLTNLMTLEIFTIIVHFILG